jgi:hypothetical protein
MNAPARPAAPAGLTHAQVATARARHGATSGRLLAAGATVLFVAVTDAARRPRTGGAS